ncbi:MAG: PIN domain-containing protein [Anaerolineae bacterium]
MTPIHPTTAPPVLCVADASILFDLRNGHILTESTSLPYRFIVPDAVFAELDAPLRLAVQSLGFEIGDLKGKTILEIHALRPEHPRISVSDLFALFLARDRQAVLLTGARRLRGLAETRGLIVHGTLWVLDRLCAQRTLDTQSALAALERILALGGRLPAGECQKRRLLWSEPSST